MGIDRRRGGVGWEAIRDRQEGEWDGERVGIDRSGVGGGMSGDRKEWGGGKGGEWG